MTRSNKFSLIVATYGRDIELKYLFESLANSIYKLFEVIIIDQNDDDFISDIVKDFNDVIDIKHIRSNRKGLSLNRNIGLKHATGDIVCFPDDDCTYYPDSLLKVNEFFNNFGFDFVLGRIYDRDLACPVIKEWPEKDKRIDRFNAYLYSSSITIFCRSNEVRFDENLGAGTEYGSCEDPDYIINLLDSGFSGMYKFGIEVNHPIPTLESFNIGKRLSYAKGFGYFLSKHKMLLLPYSIAFFIKNLRRVFKRDMDIRDFYNILMSFVVGACNRI
ncbi:glycosyltransferase family 2 protein [Vibrio fluvialis]|nr:glycosyltransferase family 2 protein [Vibrio fluvialis]